MAGQDLRSFVAAYERAPTRHDVADDRDIVVADFLEDQDRVAATPLVLEDERHHVLLDGDPVRHADDLAGMGALVGGDEAPEVLAGHGPRSYPGKGSEVEVCAEA